MKDQDFVRADTKQSAVMKFYSKISEDKPERLDVNIISSRQREY